MKMTNKEAIAILEEVKTIDDSMYQYNPAYIEALEMAITALEAQPCDNAVSREEALDAVHNAYINAYDIKSLIKDSMQFIKDLPPVTPKQKLCKDCKWWKDSDGAYRRGFDAESRCPMNCKTVFEGNGYCFLFEPKTEGANE